MQSYTLPSRSYQIQATDIVNNTYFLKRLTANWSVANNLFLILIISAYFQFCQHHAVEAFVGKSGLY
jgi:hypothetical protein